MFLASALDAHAAAPSVDHGDTAWLLMSSGLVLFMCLPGLAVFYGGMVRRKNVLSVLAQCFSVACVASIAWVFIGYPLALGPAPDCNEWLCSLSGVMRGPMPRGGVHGTVPEAAFMMFQMAFAAIAPALALGGFAERMRFGAVLIYSFCWSVIVYAPVAHWVWGEGWLAHRGALDFAGGLVVHVTSGVSALVGAFVLGDREARHAVAPPHSLPLVAIGGGVLWVGWFAFNGGSALAANDDAAMAILVTHLGACTGALTWMGAEWLRFRKPSVTGLLTGAVAGLVTITPACGYVSLVGGAAMGVIGSLVAFSTLLFVRAALPVDDALDVSSIHGMAGMTGALLTAVFASVAVGGTGLPNGNSMAQQLEIQALSVALVVVWTAVASYLLLKITERLIGLRVDDLEERAGLDIAEFGESGYVD